MKGLSRLGVAVLAAVVTTTAANATTYNLATLIANNQEIQIGDKIFGDWFWSASGTDAPTADLITITPGQAGQTYFISIGGPMEAASGNVVNINFHYSVRVDPTMSSQQIMAIKQGYTFGSQGSGGRVTIAENVWKTNFFQDLVANSTVGYFVTNDGSDPPAEQGDVLVLTEWVTKAYVTKDITLRPNTDGLVKATEIRQSFVQTPTPDSGSTLMLLGSALGFLAVMGLRRNNT